MTEVLVGGKPRKRVLEEHLARLDQRPQEGGNPTPTNTTLRSGLTYKGIEWSRNLLGGSDFHHCQTIATTNGYARCPLPRQLFALLMDYDAGLVSDDFQPLISTLINNQVWFDCLFEVKDKTILVYDIPKKLVSIPSLINRYNSVEHYNGVADFPLNNTPLGTPVLIKNIADQDLINFLWSRPFEKLPPRVQETATLMLPKLAGIYRAYSVIENTGLNIGSCAHYNNFVIGIRAPRSEDEEQ